MGPKSKVIHFKITSLVILVAAALLLLGFAGWKSYTLFGCRPVTIVASNGWSASYPMATHDAADLDLWQVHNFNHMYDDNHALEKGGRIVLLHRGTKARLLWERYGVAHVRVVDGPLAGSEGMVSVFYITDGYVDPDIDLP